MMSKAPFPPKLFYDPVTLKVTYIEVTGSIYFSYSNVTLFCHSKFEFFSYLLQGSNLLWKHPLNLYWSTTSYLCASLQESSILYCCVKSREIHFHPELFLF